MTMRHDKSQVRNNNNKDDDEHGHIYFFLATQRVNHSSSCLPSKLLNVPSTRTVKLELVTRLEELFDPFHAVGISDAFTESLLL